MIRARCVLLYEYDESSEEYKGPRTLATYAWNESSPHPHSRFSPDDSTVVFDADFGGDDADVFLVDVPDDFEELSVYKENGQSDGFPPDFERILNDAYKSIQKMYSANTLLERLQSYERRLW